MGILGIGVDIAHVPRIIRLMERRTPTKLAHRILSEKELHVWDALPTADEARRARFLAVRYDLPRFTQTRGTDTRLRWSVKEAAYKAVYPLARPTWKDFTFHSLSADGLQKPTLEHHTKDPGARLWKIHTSVSHDGEYVFATVLVEVP